MWPRRVYTRKKRACPRLNLTPTLDLGPSATAEVPPGPSRRLAAQCKPCQRGLGAGPGVRERGGQGGWASASGTPEAGKPASRAFVLKRAAFLQAGKEMVKRLVCRGSWRKRSRVAWEVAALGCRDWECPKLEEHMQYKNSTLLDTSKAVAIEKAPQFSNLSSILDNAAPEVVLAEEIYPSTPEKNKKEANVFMNLFQPEKNSETRDTNFQTKLSSRHVKIKVPSSHQRSILKSIAGKAVTKVLLPPPPQPALNTNSNNHDKKSRGPLTSTPSSQTAGLEINLSSVQKASFEELFPNVSSYVNSDEIVPVSSLQENSSNEVLFSIFPSIMKRNDYCYIRYFVYEVL
ncbi:hypothetical protein PAL_GLEAN10016907 [Pteropus alecto]|uniref:Uncharacterized protein n=1 Tax=Pteropus alecto TaxID=9402 RepID=L5JUH2_PTEAL|nr:hypothetical protein PAL_GLEAN10016907 [Pteropus alecto]